MEKVTEGFSLNSRVYLKAFHFANKGKTTCVVEPREFSNFTASHFVGIFWCSTNCQEGF